MKRISLLAMFAALTALFAGCVTRRPAGNETCTDCDAAMTAPASASTQPAGKPAAPATEKP